jgi:hypothetical protein
MLPPHSTLTHLGTCQDKDAFTPSYFWSLVKGKGGILVIVRDTKKHVFGGFVQDVFNYGWNMTGHESNFVFTLGSSTTPAVKLLKTIPGDWKGVIMDSESAFTMGAGCDLWVESGCFNCCLRSYATIAPGYPAVPLNDTLLAGSLQWVPEVIEVYMCV